MHACIFVPGIPHVTEFGRIDCGSEMFALFVHNVLLWGLTKSFRDGFYSSPVHTETFSNTLKLKKAKCEVFFGHK